jgi:L-threonylcarbamoyladenylate synthase
MQDFDPAFNQACEKILNGDVVAFPTETVYGLGARIDSADAIKKIFSTKERPFFDPLIVHTYSADQAKTCFQSWNLIAEVLSKKFWPGPLTLVMKKSEKISDLITSGLDNVGVRIPNHELALQLLKKINIPVAAPSANKFGKTSPTKSAHVHKEFGDQIFILKNKNDVGCEIGIESTVVLIRENSEISILRKGAILKSQIIECLNENKIFYNWIETADKKESPGHMKHHYMPDIPFVICKNPAMKLSELGHILNFKLNELPDTVEGVRIIKPVGKIEKIEFLKLSTDAAQAAREMYSLLRAASERKPQALCYIQMPNTKSEMWESVYDRLYKAASLIID